MTDQNIRFLEIAAFLYELGREDLVLEIVPNFQHRAWDPILDEELVIDANFIRLHGDMIESALCKEVYARAENKPDEALNLMVSSMDILSRMSISAHKLSNKPVRNIVLKNISNWKSAADKIKTNIGASSYTIGASIGLSTGVYIEMHF